MVVRHALSLEGGETTLVVELKDKAVKLTHTRKSEVYRDKSDDKVFGDILTKQGLKKGNLAVVKTKHAELVRYDCTDWDFMLSRAEAAGLLIVAHNGTVSAQEITIDKASAARHKFILGKQTIYNFDLEIDGASQHKDVKCLAWNQGEQEVSTGKAPAFKLAQGNQKVASLAEVMGTETRTLSNAVPLDQEELQAWADGALKRTRLSMIRGRIAVPGFAALKLLDVMELDKMGKCFNGKTLVTGIRHRISEGTWNTDIQLGLSAVRFARQHQVAELAAGGLLPPVHGLQIGKVAAFEEDEKETYRVKVILPGIDSEQNTVWARLATPEAGKNRGFLFRPEPGDEVVVGFFNDDPRQAVILGSMFSSANTPHEDVGKPTEKNTSKAIISKNGVALKICDKENKPSLTIKVGKAEIQIEESSIVLSLDKKNAITIDKSGLAIKTENALTIKANRVDIKTK